MNFKRALLGGAALALVCAPVFGDQKIQWKQLPATPLIPANNLSELASPSISRNNLGLGALSTVTPGSGVASAAANAANGASGLAVLNGSGELAGFTQPDTGAVARTFNQKGRDYISVLDYLPVGAPTGTTDYSTGFQAAATAGCARSSGGMTIHVPTPPSGAASKYYAHDILSTCPNRIVGDGQGGFGGTQTTTGSEFASNGGTTINYSGATSYGFAWQPASWPAVTPQNMMMGGGISNLTLMDATSDVSHAAIIAGGAFNWRASELTITAAYNGFYLLGMEFPVLENINMYHTRNVNYHFAGDLTGKTSTNIACTAANADCSTRTDNVIGRNLVNIDNGGTNTAFMINNFVDGVLLDHVAAEGPYTGLSVFCDAVGSVSPNLDPNMGNCPHYIFTYDFQAEFCAGPCIVAQDFLVLRMHQLYAYALNVAAAVNTISLSSVNYGASTTPVGRATIDGGSIIFVAQSDNIILGGTMDDITIDHNEINGGNIANNGSVGINSSGTIAHLTVDHNTVGKVDGYAGATALARAVVLSNHTTYAIVDHNNFDGVSTSVAPVLNAALTPALNEIEGNIGPGGAPTLGACGTGSTINSSGRDPGFLITVGTGTPASCAVTFGTPWDHTPYCTAQIAPGASAIASVSTSATAVTLNAATTLAAGSYTVMCK